jgi:hypothetical protein
MGGGLAQDAALKHQELPWTNGQREGRVEQLPLREHDDDGKDYANEKNRLLPLSQEPATQF